MSTDTTFNILNLQLRALADIQRQLTDLNSRSIRQENSLARLTHDLQEMRHDMTRKVTP